MQHFLLTAALRIKVNVPKTEWRRTYKRIKSRTGESRFRLNLQRFKGSIKESVPNFAKVANARKIGKTFCHKRNRADITDFSKKKSRIFNHA